MPSQFPAPAQPFSLSAIVKKIVSEPGYAAFIAQQTRKAQSGDVAAIAIIDAHFQPEAVELTGLNIPSQQCAALQKCTDKTHLLTFAAWR